MDEILASIRRIIADDELSSSPRRAAAEAPAHRYDEEPPRGEVRRWEPRAERRPATPRQDGRGPDGRGPDGRRQDARGPDARGIDPDDVFPHDAELPLSDFDGLDALQELDAHLADLRASEERAVGRRAEGRQEARQEGRQEARQEARQDGRQDGRPSRAAAPRTEASDHRRYPSDPTHVLDDRREPRGVARDGEPDRLPRRPVERREMRENLARAAAPPVSQAPQRPSLAAARGASEADAPASAGRRKDLLSPAADAAIASSLSALGDLVLPQRDRTVEDLVKEILRPMLKDWLDENLPQLVEQLVRAEIERVVRSGR
jgi:cell pole-organizing protein PopZ